MEEQINISTDGRSGDTHHALQDFAKHNVFAVQPGRLDCGDEELGAVGVFAGIGHAEPTRAVMLQLEVLIRETVSINALAYKKTESNTPWANKQRFTAYVWHLKDLKKEKKYDFEF